MRDVGSQTSENAPSDDNSNEDLPDSLQQEDTISVHSACNPMKLQMMLICYLTMIIHKI